MLTLEEYKNILVEKGENTFLNPKEKRRKYLEERYTDEYLNKIITDTYDFSREIFDMETLKDGFVTFELDLDLLHDFLGEDYIYTHDGLGRISDFLYCVYEKRMISEAILKEIFGKELLLNAQEHETFFQSEEGSDIMSRNYFSLLTISRFPDNMDEIREKLIEDEEYHQITFDEYMKRQKVLIKK